MGKFGSIPQAPHLQLRTLSVAILVSASASGRTMVTIPDMVQLSSIRALGRGRADAGGAEGGNREASRFALVTQRCEVKPGVAAQEVFGADLRDSAGRAVLGVIKEPLG